jgi:hypothetical protein
MSNRKFEQDAEASRARSQDDILASGNPTTGFEIDTTSRDVRVLAIVSRGLDKSQCGWRVLD